ncbi:MAG: response regulator [bacterium]
MINRKEGTMEDEAKNRVLLVDDDPGICETLGDILEARGFRLVSVPSGEDALRSLRRSPDGYAAVILDLILPDMDGMELAEQILEESPLSQIIVVTAYASMESAINGLRSNFVDYLEKPVDNDHLIATLYRALEHRERLIAEQAVRKAADEWRTTFDTIPDMIMIIDNEFKIQRVNKAVAEFLGLDYKQILGEPCYRLLDHAEEPPAFCPHRGKGDPAQSTWEVAYESVGKNFLVSCAPFLDQEGNRVGWVQVMRDITEKKRMEAQLLQSEKLTSVGQLAAGVAHEINNPLSFVMTNTSQLSKYVTGMKKMLDVLRERIRETGDDKLIGELQNLEEEFSLAYIDEDLEELLSESLEGMVRIRNIVADLRKFSHMGEEDTQVVDINEVVNSALNMAKSEIRLHGKVECELNSVPVFWGNWGRLAQTLLNLIINAAHSFSEDKRDHFMKITTGEENDWVYVSIEDTGEGISPEKMETIFNPFYTTKKAGEGTGLGLSIARDVARRHQGKISVESERGKGSTFTLWVPVETGLEPAREKEGREGRKEMSKGTKLLVVDDEKSVLSSLKRVLGSDYEIETALTVSEARDIISADPDGVDLVLCDLIMPGENGKDLYLEAREKWPELEERFVFFTGGAYDPALKEFARQMEHRTLQKPLNGDELSRLIEEKLESLGK